MHFQGSISSKQLLKRFSRELLCFHHSQGQKSLCLKGTNIVASQDKAILTYLLMLCTNENGLNQEEKNLSFVKTCNHALE